MDTLLQDLRFATRTLVKSPAFTLVAAVCIALGIGANTTVFSLINAALLRPLPVPEAERLVRVYTSEWDPNGVSARRFGGSSYADFRDWRSRAGVFEGLAATTRAPMNLGSGAEAMPVNGVLVTGDYFPMLRVRPAAGRMLGPADDSLAGASPVVVLSRRFWMRKFDGDRALVGRSIILNGQEFSVVGVAPEKFLGTEVEQSPDLWVPMSMRAVVLAGRNWLEGRDNRGIAVMGRLAPDVTREKAQAAMSVVMKQIGEAYPAESGKRLVTLTAVRGLVPIEEGGGEVVMVMGTLFAIVSLVLFVACANVANLLLARAAHRRREIAIRLSLGAGRRRVVRQLLTESVLLGLIGGGLGLLVAMWGMSAIQLLPIPDTLDFSIDARVLGFTLGTALATGVLFGLAPALAATRPSVSPMLKEGGSGSGSSRSRLRTVLVAGQMAFSLVVLVAAGLLARTLIKLQTADPGFATDNVLLASFDLQLRSYTRPAGEAFYEALRDRMAKRPGIAGATWVQLVPLSGGMWRQYATVPGYTPSPGEDQEIALNVVGPDYFRTIGIPIVKGRGFGVEDRATSSRVVIVNETMAKRYWPKGDAIGRVMHQGADDPQPLLVVGIVRDAKYENMTSAPIPFFYVPMSQSYSATMTLVLRSTGRDPTSLATDLRAEVKALDASLPIQNLKTMTETRGQSLEIQRLVASMLGAFGGLALLLASIGLFGVMSYLVSQRTREIGVRIALGARPASVLRLVLGEGVRLALIGVGFGLVLALAATRALTGMLYGVSASDPLTFSGVAIVLTTMAALASFVPARRATRVDPVVALRAE